ncbi:DinB/UmuC family translesion DNA polymerase [Streptomyces werraensis]|uniref:DinB/UmuC family translesion DNA polymerase n=1 Tax=Streptomyces werraensis TaxID=68284 RepID=UPI003F4DD798
MPSSATVRHTFDRHTLDGATVRATLLELVVQLGRGLRRRGQAARALTLTLRFGPNTRSMSATRSVKRPRTAWWGRSGTWSIRLRRRRACSTPSAASDATCVRSASSVCAECSVR